MLLLWSDFSKIPSFDAETCCSFPSIILLYISPYLGCNYVWGALQFLENEYVQYVENILTNCIYFSELFAKFLANDANTLKIYSLQDSLVFSVTVYLVNHMLFYMISLLKFMLCIIYVKCEKKLCS